LWRWPSFSPNEATTVRAAVAGFGIAATGIIASRGRRNTLESGEFFGQ